MQLNVFYTLHEKMQGINIGYFDLTLDIEAAFEKKRGNIKEQAEALGIVHFKTAGSGHSSLQSKYGSKKGESKYASKYGKPAPDPEAGEANPPPPYSPGGLNGTAATSPSLIAAAQGKAKPPPPKPKPSRLSGVPNAETCTALYDYEAQAHGDLSFTTGDVIEVITRTQNENEWWTGKIGIRQGQFPGKSPLRLEST